MRPTAGLRAPEVGRRALTILWGLPVVAVGVGLGGWPLAAGAAALSLAALREWWALGRPFGVGGALRPELGIATLGVLAAATAGPGSVPAALAGGVVLLVVGGVLRAAAGSRSDLHAALGGTVWAILGLLYIPWLLGHLLLLRGSGPAPLGLHRTAAAIGLIWLADVAAFLGGGALGRRPLAPGISPGKTVEGAVLGLAAAGAAAAALGRWLGLPTAAAGLSGAALAAAGLAGDLWESVLKRGAEVKDSGRGVPGHGGVLDRFDSLLLGAPIAYWLFAHAPWIRLGPWRP
jgi:phosphatidate cytidylyltransferase